MQLKNSVTAFFLFLVCILFSAGSTFAQEKKGSKSELEWHSDLWKVYDLSQKTKKPVFAFFTGSDWCGWCKKLEADVFSKKEFVSWAKKNVILLEVDFPRGKQLSPQQMQQNNNLQQSFGVGGYPTIWLFHMTKNDSAKTFSINSLGSLGYPAGAEPGKEEVKFLNEADHILKTPLKKSK
jgi:thioredoxin-related protein